MSRPWTRVELSNPPGPIWLMVDVPCTAPAGDSRRTIPVGWPPGDDWTGQLVHLISDHAGGEIRGYVLIAGSLWHRDGAPWPEMDVLVCRALGVPVPERFTEARQLRYADVRLEVGADGVCRIGGGA